MKRDAAPDKRISCSPFLGRVSNANPHFVGSGAAQTQTNIECRVAGQLDVRKGMRPVTFASEAAAVGAGVDVISIAAFDHPIGRWVIYQLTDGKLRAGRNAS